MKFIALKELDLSIFTEFDEARKLPKVKGLEGAKLVLESPMQVLDFARLKKVGLFVELREGRKVYETDKFQLLDQGAKIELILDSKAKRQLKQDILLSRSFKNT